MSGTLPLQPSAATECRCYKCAGAVTEWQNGQRVVMNNLHGKLQPCEECGSPKSEYVDLGTKGYHECWACTERAADGDLPAENPLDVTIPSTFDDY